MKKLLIKKENGDITITNIDDSLIKPMIRKISNQCFNCQNANPIKCPKIEDEVKRYIYDYDFIIDGYQLVDQNGNVDKFVITNCDNYELDLKRPKLTTKEQIMALNKLKESIKILYFDAEDIDEADRIQIDLINRGSIIYNDFDLDIPVKKRN